MARLINAEILRSTPGGVPDGADFSAGTNLVIVQTEGEATKIRIGAEQGWVPTTSVDAVGTSGGPAGAFNIEAFADICVLESLTHRVNPHYMIGVAKLRSGLSAANNGSEIGPFRLTAQEWSTVLDAGMLAGDLNTWDLQCAGFATMVERIVAARGQTASPVDLYRAQWPSAPADIAAQLKTAFDATAPVEAAAELRVIGRPVAATITEPTKATSGSIADASLRKLAEVNAQRWQAMVVAPAQLTRIRKVAEQLLARKARYQMLETTTGVPWFVIAVIHEREKSGDVNFLCNIAQGVPWNQRSPIVPQNGPFASFDDAAIEALTNCAPRAAKWKDWSIGGALTLLEQYNGLGYAFRRLPSPYIWSFTNQYEKGKFIRDHVFDPNAVDAQLGSAPLLAQMKALDPTITL